MEKTLSCREGLYLDNFKLVVAEIWFILQYQNVSKLVNWLSTTTEIKANLKKTVMKWLHRSKYEGRPFITEVVAQPEAWGLQLY